jgi:hypothetical protein
MGRPLKQKYFDPISVESGLASGTAAIFNAGLQLGTLGGNLLLQGAANIAPVTIGAGYTGGATVVFSAPPLGGTTATGTAVVFTGNTVTITNVGSGYTTTPTVVFLGVNSAPASTTIFAGQMSDPTTANVIATSAYIPAANGGTSAIASDIISQRGSRRYRVKNSQGTGVCALVAAAPGAGQMTITARDSAGNTYYVTKLMDRKCRLTQNTGTQFATGAIVKWVLAPSSAIINDTVAIDSN